MKRKKITTYALTAIVAAGMVMSTPAVPVHASEVGDILDDIFGGNKPEHGSHDDGPSYDEGQGKHDGSEMDDPVHNPPSQPSKPSEPSTPPSTTQPSEPSHPSAPTQSNVPGQPADNNPQEQPAAGSNIGSGFGTAVGGSATGSVTVNTVNETVTVITGTDGSGTVAVPVAGCVFVPVADPAILTVFPSAMYVFTPEGAVTFNCLDAAGATYSVWVNGEIADQFGIVDARGKAVTVSAPELVNDETGKTFVNVTVAAKTKGAKVNATEAQKSAFTRLFGIDGVMINGVLVEEFKDTMQK